MRKGFTLAEVLITIGIIGVVSALTIPSLIAEYKEKQIVTRVKKEYSMLSQAVRMMIAYNGQINEWGDQSYETFERELLKQLKVVKSCNEGHLCGAHYMNMPAHVLSNGLIVQLRNRRDCSVDYSTAADALSGKKFDIFYCASVNVYLSSRYNSRGHAIPNYKNKVFNFVVYSDGVLPQGHKNAGYDGNFKFCAPDSISSANCTAWVLYNENIDYNYCKDKLSWDGAHSCKEAK